MNNEELTHKQPEDIPIDLKVWEKKEKTFIWKEMNSSQNSLMEKDLLSNTKTKTKGPSYRCSDCNQEYCQARLTKHQCEPHLKNFNPFKRNRLANRYQYRCLIQLCDWIGRKSYTQAHHLQHLSRNQAQHIPKGSDMFECMAASTQLQTAIQEKTQLIKQQMEEEALKNPQNWRGNEYYSKWKKCVDKFQKPTQFEAALLIFLAILYKQTMNTSTIRRRPFFRSLICHIGFPAIYKANIYKNNLEFNYISLRYIQEKIKPTTEGGQVLLVIRRDRVEQHLKQLVEGYYWQQSQLKSAARFSKHLRAEPHRHKIPSQMKDVAQTCRNYKNRHTYLASKRTKSIKKYGSSMIFKKYYHTAYINHRFRVQRLKFQVFKKRINNVFEDPVKINHRKQRQIQQMQMVKEIIFRAIADFLSVERYHLQYMGLFELLKQKRATMKGWDGQMARGFTVTFPPLKKPHQLLLDNEWYAIPEDFFKLFKNWLPTVAQAQRSRFAESIPFPEFQDSSLISQSIEWLKIHKLWMPSSQSRGVYQQIHFWDMFALGGYWKNMRDKKLQQYKKKISQQMYSLQSKIGSQFKVIDKNSIILREDTRDLPKPVNILTIIPQSPTMNLLQNRNLWQLLPLKNLESNKVTKQQLQTCVISKINSWKGEFLCYLCCKWADNQCFKCCHCGIVYHNYCIALYLDNQPHGGKCPACRMRQPQLKERIGLSIPDLISKGSFKLVYKQYPYRWFKKLEDLTQAEEQRFNQQIAKVQQVYKCQYTVLNRYHEYLHFYPAWNTPEVFNIINRNDYLELMKLHQRRATLPVSIVTIPGKGRGLIAARQIELEELVAVYSGIVMSSVAAQKIPHLRDYLVAAFEGPGTQETSVIVPHYFAGFGHVLNGAPSSSPECNCEMANFLCFNGIVSLLRAKRVILKGEELQWNYNGRLEQYNMNFDVKSEHMSDR